MTTAFPSDESRARATHDAYRDSVIARRGAVDSGNRDAILEASRRVYDLAEELIAATLAEL